MSDTRHAEFPAVIFDRLGPVTAREAVRIIDARGNDVTDLPTRPGQGHSLAVLHPEGGRIYVDHELTAEMAKYVADDLREVLTAWVAHALDR